MNTANIKSFAQKARLLLMEGVATRLIYWGFDENGNSSQNLQETTGGYTFRGEVFTDTAVPEKWKMLKARLKDSQAVKDVIEEAAYTWFNRLMAIKILEKNGYLAPHLKYVDNLKVPEVLQRAKRGDHELNYPLYKDLLREYLQEDKEEDALGLLLTRFSNNNPLLHEVFGRIDDYTEILLPQNLLQPNGILDLINSDFIEDKDYKEVELIGWLYQFYISDKKDEVFKGFKKNKKARAEDIPAATQIFTPKWIVKYMVENTLGKAYLDLEPDSSLKGEMKYLVENETETTAEPIVDDIAKLSLLDPASGSGHILVTGFELLFKMYREAGYNAKQATLSILENNLFGLDIDERAMQLARFAVLLKAAKEYPEILETVKGKIQLPHIYAFPEAADFSNEELQTFLGEGREHLAHLKDALILLKQGKNIGAALKFELPEAARTTIADRFDQWIKQEDNLDFNKQLIWNKLKSFVEVLLVMTRKYTAVVANPPYMGLNNLNPSIISYLENNYWSTRHDLSNVFIRVCLNLLDKNGLLGMINQQAWMFSKSYIDLRKDLLEEYEFIVINHLGPHAFNEIKGEVVQSVAFIARNRANLNNKPLFIRLVESKKKKEEFFETENRYHSLTQRDFNQFEQYKFQYGVFKPLLHLIKEKKFIKNFFDTREGLTTGDNNRFLRLFFEVDYKKISEKWFKHVKGGDYRKWYGNLINVVNWENDGLEIKNNKTETGRVRSHNYNEDFIFKPGFTWDSFGKITSFRYVPQGLLFDSSGSMGFNLKENLEELKFTLGYLNSSICQSVLPYIKGNNNAKPGHISLVPFINKEGNNITFLVDKNISISKYDWDSRETSWDFELSPLLKTGPGSLKEAFIQWLESAKEDFFQLHENEEELNRIFINIYGLQEELTPKVQLKDITILQEELNRKSLEKLEAKFRKNGKEAIELPIQEDELMSQFISYLIGIMMGRYRLDKPGLNIAHPNPSEEELSSYEVIACDNTTHKISIDKDGILPLMGEDCAFPDDVLVQLKKLLHAIWGEESLTANINFLQQSLSTNLHNWLTTKFWKYHTGMYKKKPIYWLFASNPKKPEKSAFKVLTYMHRMDKFTVQQIQRNYLYPHQDHIKAKRQTLKENEANLSREEQKELEKLHSWELELRDYNEVLKDLANRQIEFDLDDGVSVNYEKFEGAVAKI